MTESRFTKGVGGETSSGDKHRHRQKRLLDYIPYYHILGTGFAFAVSGGQRDTFSLAWWKKPTRDFFFM